MKRCVSLALVCAVLVVLADLPGSGSPSLTCPALAGGMDREAPAAVIVQVASGRTFAGDLASRTDAAQLWLWRQRGSATVLRPIEWDRVVRVSVLGQEFSGAELQQMVQKILAEK